MLMSGLKRLNNIIIWQWQYKWFHWLLSRLDFLVTPAGILCLVILISTCNKTHNKTFSSIIAAFISETKISTCRSFKKYSESTFCYPEGNKQAKISCGEGQGWSHWNKYQTPKKSLDQKLTPKKSHVESPSLKNFQQGLNNIRQKRH